MCACHRGVTDASGAAPMDARMTSYLTARQQRLDKLRADVEATSAKANTFK
jgi:hypothetical protein